MLDDGSNHVRNVGQFLRDCMAQDSFHIRRIGDQKSHLVFMYLAVPFVHSVCAPTVVMTCYRLGLCCS